MFAGVFRTPDNGILFETRSQHRAAPETVAVPVGDWPVWVKLVRRANSFAAYYSTDGDRWTRIGEAVTVPMPTTARGGLAVTSHDGGRWTVRGAGQNIWGSADEFQFAHTGVTGDAVITARIDSQDRTHSWAKAGLMIRAGTGESAQFAGVFRTPENGIVFESRSANRATPQSAGVSVGDGPIWVRLVRRANSFAAYYSYDGDRWTRIGTAETINMPRSARAGLAVTSHETRQLGTATFSGVTVSR